MKKNDLFDLQTTRNEYLKIKNVSGIYVLSSDDHIVLYVGKSVSLRHRVKSHLDSTGNFYIKEYAGNFYFIDIIYHDDLATLDNKETDIINLLKPMLNSSKVKYPKNIDISSINEYERLVTAKCKHDYNLFNFCGSVANINGYCTIHDPNNFHFSWIFNNKLITTEMQRLLFENEFTRQSLYFYMNNITFGKLLSEKTFAKIDYTNEEIVLRFKKHFIIIDEDEAIRLEIKRQP